MYQRKKTMSKFQGSPNILAALVYNLLREVITVGLQISSEVWMVNNNKYNNQLLKSDFTYS